MTCNYNFPPGIKFAARLNMETERDAFVCSLAKFTYLATVKEMTQKNVECVKVLLEIGLQDGNYLASSWEHVLHCISHLERLQLIRTLKPDSHFFDDDSNSNKTPTLGGDNSHPGSRGSTNSPMLSMGQNQNDSNHNVNRQPTD